MSVLIYGAYGYTGLLIAEEAGRRDGDPILAGRNEDKLREVGHALDLSTRTVSLEASDSLRSVLDEVSVVIHCAGPYVQTVRPMVEACLDTGTHYLDLTGEARVFRWMAGRDEEAREAGVMLLPGIGFDVVASDCMGRYVAERVPHASTLEIALYAQGGVSQGTLRTVVENLGQQGLVRREGRLRKVPHGWTSRTVNFGDRSRQVVSIPDGSIVTSGYSTNVPNVTTYLAFPKMVQRVLGASRYLQGVATWSPVRRLFRELVERGAQGPSDEQRAEGRSVVWASARRRDKGSATARLYGPEVYTFTARSAVRALEMVIDGTAPAGYQTPSTAFGDDFPLEISRVEREVVSSPDG